MNKQHLKIFLNDPENWRLAPDYNSRLDLKDADFSNLNLENADFQYADLTNAKFNNCRLNGADFMSAILDNVDLRNAQIERAFFGAVEIKVANLAHIIKIWKKVLEKIDHFPDLGKMIE